MGGKNSPESINRYMAKAYDRITILVPKGDKEKIKDYAQAHSESVNAFIGRIIAEAMERDSAAHEAAPAATGAMKRAGE